MSIYDFTVKDRKGNDVKMSDYKGKVPFYCAAWSNNASVRNALRSGFRPGWVEVTAKTNDFIEKMNKK